MGASTGPNSSTFDTIHSIDMTLSTYNELPLDFQLNVTKWCTIDFHGNHCYIDDVTGGRHLGFFKKVKSFQILFKFKL